MLVPVVYIVDDDPLVTRSLGTALELETPWQVRTFESGAAALAAMAAAPPAVVVSDFKMPGMDGLTFLRRVRAAHADAILILLTGYADKDAAVAAINEVGIWQFVEKPWDLGDLLQKLRTGIEKRELSLRLADTLAALEKRNHQLEHSLAELARAQERLLDAQERLVESERLAAVGQVASGIAHELGNQLAFVGYAELIARRAREQGDTETLEHAEVLMATHRRLLTMVSEIKDFTRSGARYVKEPIDVGHTIEEALKILRYDADVRRVKVKLEVTARPIAVAHSGKLTQVLINLIRNAAQASSDGQEVIVFLHESNEAVTLGVQDHGPGMAPELLARVGEPFLTTKPSGTGLGLGIARKIAREHGGELDVRSTVGEGTIVTIRLPTLAAAEAAAAVRDGA